ncbi:hypothetical protein AUR66_16330 [Haloferax profundi]|uniref:Dual OB-containing domain-containing protein n=2 Tax=Haloferax profundi TaxID=1544718 RepID=A0A0W1SGW9_9EURY|nr:hypothetical protein AUR66_16330 [Haloferax profundi]
MRSLTLVSPIEPEFYVREKDNGKFQPRTGFKFGGYNYDFPITAPKWREQARTKGIDSLPTAEDVGDDEEILFTISLGEATRNTKRCYKLVAAVFSIDSDKVISM